MRIRDDSRFVDVLSIAMLLRPVFVLRQTECFKELLSVEVEMVFGTVDRERAAAKLTDIFHFFYKSSTLMLPEFHRCDCR